jgi:hypothetical protein
MRYPIVSTALALALTVPGAAALAQRDTTSPPKWSLSLGVDPSHFDLKTRDPGIDARLVANLAREWQAPGSRFSRHVALMLGGDYPQGSNTCYGCLSGRQYAALTAGVGVDLFRVSRFTPYLKTGAGIYYTHLTANMNGVGPRVTRLDNLNNFSLGVNGGLGIKARLGGHEFFVEQMLHAFDVRAYNSGVYPLNFGIRF